MSNIQSQIDKILTNALAEAKELNTTTQVEEFRQKYLGRKSQLTEILRNIKNLSDSEKKIAGAESNKAKQSIEAELARLQKQIINKEYKQKLQQDYFDITASHKTPTSGSLHPMTKERMIVEDIFISMGFTIYEPQLIDNEYNNFTSLNIPANHPAKDMWDTIWTEDDDYLITHTSSMQNRIISSNEPPIRGLVPGRCFRNEATDRTHEHSFFQIEGVYVDKGIKLADLIGTLQEFLSRYYKMEVPIKIQPTFFPFVEPGLELMVQYDIFMKLHNQKSSPLAGQWLELIPCGPIHPFVIKEAGLEPDTYSGFAWGLGLDRLIMLKYAIDDIRYIHSGKLDFTRQFS